MPFGLNFRTTDNSKWGAGNGSGTGGNLTPDQADDNTWELHSRVTVLEDNPPTAISIESFTVIGSQMQVNMTDGSTQGPFDLPIATFNMTGDWVNSYPYKRLDIFTVPHDGLYFVEINHTSPDAPAVFDPTADDGSGNLLYTKIFGDDSYIYDVGWFYPGLPGLGIDDDGAIAGHEFVRPVVFPATLDGSKATLRIAPAADCSFPVQINGVAKGSVDFASGETAGTFTWTDDVSCAAGDVVYLMKPDPLDGAMRDLTVSLLLTRLFDT
jgi:hypothetical protein